MVSGTGRQAEVIGLNLVALQNNKAIFYNTPSLSVKNIFYICRVGQPTDILMKVLFSSVSGNSDN
jgi:hypothetical protein